MTLLLGWVASLSKPATNGLPRALTHARATLVLGVVCTLFCLGFAALAASNESAVQRWAAVPLLAVAVISGVGGVGEALLVRHELAENGIVYRGLWKRYVRVPWREIVSVRWNPWMRWLVLRTRDGRVLRFSVLLIGFNALAQELYERQARLQMSAATLKILADARHGIFSNV